MGTDKEIARTRLEEVLNGITDTKVLTRIHVCQFLGVSDPTMSKWAREGGGPPFFRVGQRGYRYFRDDVINYALESYQDNPKH